MPLGMLGGLVKPAHLERHSRASKANEEAKGSSRKHLCRAMRRTTAASRGVAGVVPCAAAASRVRRAHTSTVAAPTFHRHLRMPQFR
eukprot:scaffold97074_cov28-Tisochrysis_lutea.AAC.5